MTHPWIQTASGRALCLVEPRPEDIVFDDIAFALSNLNRFTGHAGLMSVAQHSVHVSELVPAEHALVALMHDAHEAYCGDVASPIKRVLGDVWKTFEARMWRAVATRFGLPVELPECVKHADLIMLASEKYACLPHWPREWMPMPGPVSLPRSRWTPERARDEFRLRFEALGGKP